MLGPSAFQRAEPGGRKDPPQRRAGETDGGGGEHEDGHQGAGLADDVELWRGGVPE